MMQKTRATVMWIFLILPSIYTLGQSGFVPLAEFEEAGAAGQAQAIRPCSKNPWYWEYRGEPVILIGGSDDDNLFQWNGVELIDHLDLLVSAGGNYLRNTMSDRDEGNLYPFKLLADGKYDLEQWNDAFWHRLSFFLEETSKRDIIVQLTLWDHFDIGSRQWVVHPWNPDNNINMEAGTWKGRSDFYSTVDRKALGEIGFQQGYVDKLLSIALSYNNVLYNINNESSESGNWENYWALYMKDEAEKRGKQIYVTNMQLSAANAVRHVMTHSQIFDYVDISQNNQDSKGARGTAHWDNLMFLREKVASFGPIPMNNVKIYGATDGSTNYSAGSETEAIDRFWRNIFGGCASARFHRPSVPEKRWGAGLNERVQTNLKAMNMLLQKLDIVSCSPHNDLLSPRVSVPSMMEAYVTANIGRQYAIYFPQGRYTVNLDPWIYVDKMKLQWLDINDLEWSEPEIVEVKWEGGKDDWGFRGLVGLETPGNRPCVALLEPVDDEGQKRMWSSRMLDHDAAWFASDEARTIASSVIRYQSSQGGWPKSTDLARPPQTPDDIPPEGGGRANSLDNDATTLPMEFLARVIHETGEEQYIKSFNRGLDYFFHAQYHNGGWPQFWPLRGDKYYSRITFNDGAMIRAMNLLQDVASGREPYTFVDGERRSQADAAVQLGIDCILKTQIKQKGKRTAWCAQHDEKTLEPAWARAYEPPSLSGGESVGIVRFLMSIKSPSPEIIDAVEGAVTWFREVAISGVRVESKINPDGRRERFLVDDPDAPPLWARFYEPGTNRPLYLDRDSKFRYDFSEISYERRSGYSYHGYWPASLLEKDYPTWREKYLADAPVSGKTADVDRIKKPRVIVMTDGEIDDHSSMIRFLLYTCDADVCAIIETNSIFQRHGHSEEDWYEKQLEAYAEVYPNLIKHHPGYPAAEKLREVSFVGDEDPDHLKGLREKRWELIPGAEITYTPEDWPDTPGSDKIVEVLLEENPEPVYIQAWGGGNTAARAFYKLKTEHPEDYHRAVSKAVMYNIWYQDGAGNYIERHHPEVTMIYCASFNGTWNYRSQTGTYDFIEDHVKNDHGPLGALYPQDYVSEGDSPAFFYSILNGLRNYVDPTFGGWGGRFSKTQEFENVYKDAVDGGDKLQSLKIWIDDVNRDFQARMDWCIAEEYEDANHHPEVQIKGEQDRTVSSGETVTLDAGGSTDPDGDEIVFHWWQYKEAGTYDGLVELQGSENAGLTFTAPDVSRPETIHIILEVTDQGEPALSSYQRCIITVTPGVQ